MTILVTVLLLVVFSLALVMGLLSVLRDLVERSPQDSPIFHDPGPIFIAVLPLMMAAYTDVVADWIDSELVAVIP